MSDTLRNLNVYAALGAMAWLIGTLTKQATGRVHWSVTAYLFAQIGFMACVRWADSKLGHLAADLDEFKLIYGLAQIAPVIFMLAIAVRYSMEHGRFYGFAALLICAAFAGGICFVLRRYVLTGYSLASLTPTIRNHFILASVLLAAGFTTLLSLAAPSRDIETAIKVGLGLCWVLDGAYRFAYALAMLNPHLRTAARYDWLPVTLALVMAAGLSHYLNSSQRELGFQSLPDLERIERGSVPSEQMALSREVSR